MFPYQAKRFKDLEARVEQLERAGRIMDRGPVPGEEYPVTVRCHAVRLEWLERAVHAILGHLGLKFVQQRDVLVPDGETGTAQASKLTH